jgi:hypothetical protein
MAKGLKKTPHYNTVVQRAAAGRGTSSTSLMPYPTYDFEFDLDSIQGNEAAAASVLASFQGTFMASGGQGGWFLFTDPQDDTVAYGTSCMLNVTAGAANPMGQTGDGSSTQFQLGRLVGGIGIDVIQNLNGSAAVKVNGTLTSVSVLSPSQARQPTAQPCSGLEISIISAALQRTATTEHGRSPQILERICGM